jgi:hypothetical protein
MIINIKIPIKSDTSNTNAWGQTIDIDLVDNEIELTLDNPYRVIKVSFKDLFKALSLLSKIS